MDRASILTLLQEHRDVITTRFGAKHLALFGSAARDEMRPDSEVDVLADFDGPATFDGYFELKDYLEGLLCRPVEPACACLAEPCAGIARPGRRPEHGAVAPT